jgi:hypothetical protein
MSLPASSLFRSLTIAVAVFAFFAALALESSAATPPGCKGDGAACRTNQSCCSGACINGAPPGSKPFGVCCAPTTCAAQEAECGTVANGTCPQPLNCGSCTAPDTCGGGGTPNVCGCTPTTCEEQSANCGTIADGCGAALDCGTCTAPATCGGDGTANVCGGEVPCETTADCATGRKCVRGYCEPRLTNFRPCFDALDCLSGCCCNSGAAICTFNTDSFIYPTPGICTDPSDCSISGDDACPLALAPEQSIYDCH